MRACDYIEANSCAPGVPPSRRSFVTRAALGAGIAMLSTAAGGPLARSAWAAGNIEALLLMNLDGTVEAVA